MAYALETDIDSLGAARPRRRRARDRTAGRAAIVFLDAVDPAPWPGATDASHDEDPGALVLTCANCGAAMDERKCKLICRCGYFLSCSDYY